jgi:hypothetical protein
VEVGRGAESQSYDVLAGAKLCVGCGEGVNSAPRVDLRGVIAILAMYS